jgi:hypothetical protein
MPYIVVRVMLADKKYHTLDLTKEEYQTLLRDVKTDKNNLEIEIIEE